MFPTMDCNRNIAKWVSLNFTAVLKVKSINMAQEEKQKYIQILLQVKMNVPQTI